MEFTWLIVIIICSFIEVMTEGLVSIWFIASALVALIASIFTDSILLQMGIFVLLGTFLLFITRKPLQKMIDKHKEKTNLDRIYDMVGTVTEEIKKHETGIVKIDGKEWTAFADATIEKNSIVKVLEIKSTKLKVEKVEE